MLCQCENLQFVTQNVKNITSPQMSRKLRKTDKPAMHCGCRTEQPCFTYPLMHMWRWSRCIKSNATPRGGDGGNKIGIIRRGHESQVQIYKNRSLENSQRMQLFIALKLFCVNKGTVQWHYIRGTACSISTTRTLILLHDIVGSFPHFRLLLSSRRSYTFQNSCLWTYNYI